MNNSYWVLYASHDKPQFYADAGGGQVEQRNASLKYVTSYRTALDIGSNIGQWTRPLAKVFDQVICFEPNPNFRECFRKNISETNVSKNLFLGSGITFLTKSITSLMLSSFFK